MSYEFTDELNEPCAMHDFFVSASNAAGQGMNVTLQETIPICKCRVCVCGGGGGIDVHVRSIVCL